MCQNCETNERNANRPGRNGLLDASNCFQVDCENISRQWSKKPGAVNSDQSVHNQSIYRQFVQRFESTKQLFWLHLRPNWGIEYM